MIGVEHLLNTEVVVRRREVTEDVVGGQIVEWVPVATVRARVSTSANTTASEIVTALSTNERVPYQVYVLPESDVGRGDVLDDELGRHLFVSNISWPSEEIYHRADCREYQEEEIRGAA